MDNCESLPHHLLSVSRFPNLGDKLIFQNPEVYPTSPRIPQHLLPKGYPPHFRSTNILSFFFSTPQVLFADSMRTNFNVFPFYSLLSLPSSFSLSILLGTIRNPKAGPEPCNIVRKWLAGWPPRGLPKWHYLNEFFTVHGLARRLTDPKIQSC